MHAPLIFVLPPHLRAQAAAFLTPTVEAVSLFPTLVDLAKLPPLPRCPSPADPASDKVKLCADGLSLAPLLLPHTQLSPEHAALASGAVPAFSQWAGGKAMGYTMRTQRYRFTEWVNHTSALTPAWDGLLARELYDHEIDPAESRNIVADPAQAANVAALSRQLHAARSGPHLKTDEDSIRSVVYPETFGCEPWVAAFNCTAALEEALARCEHLGGCVLELRNGTYLSWPLTLVSRLTLRIQRGAVLEAPRREDWPEPDCGRGDDRTRRGCYFLAATGATDLKIEGEGRIEGHGQPWWALRRKNHSVWAPGLLGCTHCSRAVLRQVTFSNSPHGNIVFANGSDVLVDGLNISAPQTAPNTDGLNILQCRNFTMRNCLVSNGDDGVAVDDGDDYFSGSSGVVIHDNRFVDGHGASIGSIRNGTVHGVVIRDCSFKNTDNGARIKTWEGGSGEVRDIVYMNLVMEAVTNPIVINQHYTWQGNGSVNPHPPGRGNVRVTDILIRNVTATGWKSSKGGNGGGAGWFDCSDAVACTGIRLEDVHIYSDVAGEVPAPAFRCQNARGTAANTTPSAACLSAPEAPQTDSPAPVLKGFVVAIEGGAHTTVFAAHQLAHFIGIAAGRSSALPVLTADSLAPGQPAFFVGPGAARTAGVAASALRSPSVIRDDGMFCSSTPDLTRVILTGGVPDCWPACNQTADGARGTVNAVFEYLRLLGFGFYSVNATALPAALPVAQPAPCNRVHSPSFNYRLLNPALFPYGPPWPGSGGSDEATRPLYGRSLWAVANHLNGAMDGGELPALPQTWGGAAGGAEGYNIAGFVHTSENIVPSAKYPEWYGGSHQLCWTNQSLVKYLSKTVCKCTCSCRSRKRLNDAAAQRATWTRSVRLTATRPSWSPSLRPTPVPTARRCRTASATARQRRSSASSTRRARLRGRCCARSTPWPRQWPSPIRRP